MKRFTLVITIMLCLSSYLFGCSHSVEDAVPSSNISISNGTSKSDENKISSEKEQSVPDKQTCEKYIEELGFFLNSPDWKTPLDISPSQYVMWYGYKVKDLPTVSEYMIDDKDGLFFPEQEFEDIIFSFFDIPSDYLRSDSSVYLGTEHLYRTPAALMPLAESDVEILDVKQDGETIGIEFTLDFAEYDSKNVVLEIEENSEGFKFLSYKSQ